MELHEALARYRAHIESVLAGMTPPPTDAWVRETTDRLMAQFNDGTSPNGRVAGELSRDANILGSVRP